MKPRLIACLLGLSGALGAAAPAADFVRDVKPILEKHCLSCHGPEKQRASLRVDSARALLAGGSSGPSVVPGKSGESLLIKAMLGGGDDVKVMPPKGPRVSAAEITLVRRWIDAGAQVPASETVTPSQVRSRHWSFQPVVRPTLPAVRDVTWPRNGIDRFILSRLEKAGVTPSPQADPATLLRRVHLDLTGVPPTPEEIAAFLADRRPGAYERAVERLLASPHYGERWGRHWLDQARYADSNGYSIDSARTIWRYRDWVIRALNDDLPFDRFTTEQLAGDLLPKATPEQRVATGFHRNTQINEEGGIDLEQFRVEAVVDRVNTTGAVWLGLTFGCAQCHDHKYDPITQKDYYQLYAFFNNSDDPRIDLLSPEVLRRRQELLARQEQLERTLFQIDRLNLDTLERWIGSLSTEARRTLPKRIQTIVALPPNGRNARQIDELMAAYRRYDQLKHLVGGFAGPLVQGAQLHLLTRRIDLEQQIARLKQSTPPTVTTLVVSERKMPRSSFIQLGGDFLKKGAPVTAGMPAFLPAPANKSALNRLDLASWLIDGKHPLTGRVLVNRLWMQYFGLGLVETENDFGLQGLRPSNPELLDWLADEVVRQGWSLKQMHRLIVTSAAYQQSSHARPDLRTLDPRNLLVARQNRLRLEAEVVRDVALSASGLLVRQVGGPSVFPPQPEGVYSLTQVPKNWVASTGPDRFRRGLYTYFWRSAPHPGLTVFDAPDATATCTRRNRSNTPLQALTLLNDQAFLECAQGLVQRVFSEERDAEQRLSRAACLCLGRQPTANETRILRNVLTRQRTHLVASPDEARALVQASAVEGVPLAEQAAWVQVARVLLNLDEFITRE
ncbi:MAG: PSD1 and planctomycete cytochrome C domain-containing protein [Gemmataceae bacterium]